MNSRYKLLFTTLMVFILVLQGGALMSVMAASTDEPITVGVVLSFTGPFSGFMEYFRQGVYMALDDINEAGGVNGREIELVSEDVASAVAPAIAAFKKTLNDYPEMVAIIGSGASAIVRPLLPYIKEAKIAFISQATSPELHKHDNPYFFRVQPHDEIPGQGITKYVVDDLGKEKIALLYSTDEYGKSGIGVVRAALADYGIKPVYDAGWSIGDKDFSGQLTKAVASGAEVLMGWGHIMEVGLLLKQMHQLGFKDSFDAVAGGTSFAETDVIKMTPEGSDGVYASMTNYPENPDPDLQKVRKAYQEKHNREVDNLVFCGYDALHLVVEALKKMDTSKKDLSREEFRDALASIENYKGTLATFSFDELNNGVHQVMVVQVVDGAPKMIKTVKVDK